MKPVPLWETYNERHAARTMAELIALRCDLQDEPRVARKIRQFADAMTGLDRDMQPVPEGEAAVVVAPPPTGV